MIRKILILLSFCSIAYSDTTTPRLGLIQPAISFGDIWGQKYNNAMASIDAGTAVLSSSNTFISTNTYTQDINLAYGNANQCLATNASKDVITQACAGGGGGGSSALALFVGAVQISSPTALVRLSSNSFVGGLVGSATSQIDLLPTTTYFVQNNPASQQSAVVKVTTGTIGNLTASTFTVTTSATLTNATLQGPTLAYSSGSFLNSVAIGTTNVNGQSLRVIDTNGSGIASFESSTNTLMTLNIKNKTNGSNNNLALSVLGTAGDGATGASAGDTIIRAANNIYFSPGGAAVAAEMKVSTTGVIVASATVSGQLTAGTLRINEDAGLTALTLYAPTVCAASVGSINTGSILDLGDASGVCGTDSAVFLHDGGAASGNFTTSGFLWGQSASIESQASLSVIADVGGLTLIGNPITIGPVKVYPSSFTVAGSVQITSNTILSGTTFYQDFTIGVSSTIKAAASGLGWLPPTFTKATIAALAPLGSGYHVGCSDCTSLLECVSTGTVAGSWASPISKTTACN